MNAFMNLLQTALQNALQTVLLGFQNVLLGFVEIILYTASLLIFPGLIIPLALIPLGFDSYATMFFILQGAVVFGTPLGIRRTYALVDARRRLSSLTQDEDQEEFTILVLERSA